jgi:hypothetical protein
MHFLQNILDNANTGINYISIYIANTLAGISSTNIITALPLANLFDGPGAHGIPCDDPFVQLASSGLGFFLNTLMETGAIIGLICIVLSGLLHISALTTQKKEDKDERMFLSKFAFIGAIIFLIPTLICFVLLILLPNWYGLGNETCR